MKTYRFYIMTLALTFLFAGCSEDELTKGSGAKVGDDVQFGLSLSNLDTRTVYGEENTDSKTFPIYWVNGDKVRVASPQCLSGRNSAEYQIAVASATQNYATSMTKTGDAGVQWGNAATADFYSIYPSSASTSLEVSGEGVTTTLHVDATQFASTTDKGTSYYAQPAEMGNVVMYAKAADVASGDTVKLRYTPFSTVLEFEINAPTQGGEIAGEESAIIIQSLTLTAPTGTTIAGDFSFNFDGPSITPDTKGGSNSITMHFLDNNQYTTVLSISKTTLKAKMCLMPISGNLAGWKIEVNTNTGTFSKTLTKTDKDGKNTDLIAGQVHKIKLPTLSYASKEWVYDPANWIPSLPDYTNIYLSEVSLPGAWYAGSTETYQATSDISKLWNAGVRAFAVECRTCSTLPAWSTHWTPNYICISGTGDNTALGTNAYRSGRNIKTVIESIQTALQNHSDEYAVLVLSYADGGEGGHRDEDHAFFLKGIADALSGYSDIICDKEINANTTINDVKGKLIVKVNVDSDIPIGDYKGMNALISYNPFLQQMTNVDYSKPYYSGLYWSSWADSYKSYALVDNPQAARGNEDNLVWVFSSANRTHTNNPTTTIDIPTYAQRQSALGAMMVYSKKIYDASTHNVWFYFNSGGTQATKASGGTVSPTDFASTMNSWLLNTIKAKTDPSPLGIVMFNQCTNTEYNGPAIIDEIIKMNSKFYLKHAGTSGGSTGGDATPVAEIKSLSKTHDSGMVNSKTDAISPGTGKN